MSHFAVLVIGDDIEKQLEKYEETEENENSKWDWWVLGGRWGGGLAVKKTSKEYEEPLVDPFSERDEEYMARVKRWKADKRTYTAKVEDLDKRKTEFNVYAILQNGEWEAMGEMGWFGTSQDEWDKAEWVEHVKEVVKALPDGTRLTIVDCHI